MSAADNFYHFSDIPERLKPVVIYFDPYSCLQHAWVRPYTLGVQFFSSLCHAAYLSYLLDSHSLSSEGSGGDEESVST